MRVARGLVTAVVVTVILMCGPAGAFFDDFESETVGNQPSSWTALWQPIRVADNGGAQWSGKFVCGPAQNPDDQVSVVTGLILGDTRIEVDHINMGSGGGAGGSGLILLRSQGNRDNGLYLNLLGGAIYFHWKVGGSWGPGLGIAAYSDGLSHHGANSHVVITAQGSHVVARSTLIDNPTVFAESVVDLPGLWSQGYVGLMISERTNPPHASGFDNFRAEQLIPEPASLMALSAGLLGMLGFVRRRR